MTATLDATTNTDVHVHLRFGGDAGTEDYSAGSSTIRIPAGSTSSSMQIQAREDSLDENAETVIVAIESATDADASGAQPVVVTIEDNDAPPFVRLSKSDDKIKENRESVTVRAVLSGASGLDVTVQLAFAGSATHGQDYSRSGDTITVPRGATEAAITITTIPDQTEEPKESIRVTIENVVNGREWEEQRVTIEIEDETRTTSSTTTRPSTTTTTSRATTTSTTTSSSGTRTTSGTTTTPTSNAGSSSATSSSTTAGTASTNPNGWAPPPYVAPVTTTITTTDSEGQVQVYTQVFEPPTTGGAAGSVNHTTNFRADRPQSIEGQGSPGPGALIAVLAAAAALAGVAARRRR